MITSGVNLETSGIYAIIHRDSGAIYIGSSTNIKKRIRQHASKYKHSMSRLYSHMRQNTISDYDFELIEKCDPVELIDRESFWIKFFNSCSPENLNTNPNPSIYDFGGKRLLATRQRISMAAIRRFQNKEQREIARANQLGKRHTKETRRKISLITKEKLSCLSPEAKARMGSMKGKSRSNEFRMKVSIGQRQMNPEVAAIRCEKIRSNNLRRSAEMLRRIADKRSEYWLNEMLRRKNNLSKPCPICGTMFYPIRKGHRVKSCSRKCGAFVTANIKKEKKRLFTLENI